MMSKHAVPVIPNTVSIWLNMFSISMKDASSSEQHKMSLNHSTGPRFPVMLNKAPCCIRSDLSHWCHANRQRRKINLNKTFLNLRESFLKECDTIRKIKGPFMLVYLH